MKTLPCNGDNSRAAIGNQRFATALSTSKVGGMKTSSTCRALLVALTLFAGIASFAAELAPPTTVRIQSLGRNDWLRWTNDVLTTAPVYDVLGSSSPAGPWLRAATVTNQLSAPISAATAFYKIAWVKDATTTFDYAFDEGYGFTAVAGQLNASFVPGAALGSWSCEDILMFDYQHPTGNGSFTKGNIYVEGNTHYVVLAFTPISDNSGVFLYGQLSIGTVNGKPAYTGFSGYVYRGGWIGADVIGEFVATRR